MGMNEYHLTPQLHTTADNTTVTNTAVTHSRNIHEDVIAYATTNPQISIKS